MPDCHRAFHLGDFSLSGVHAVIAKYNESGKWAVAEGWCSAGRVKGRGSGGAEAQQCCRSRHAPCTQPALLTAAPPSCTPTPAGKVSIHTRVDASGLFHVDKAGAGWMEEGAD